jgi:hypothetical protein
LLLACRRQPLGIAIAGVTATLLPVIHLIPVSFDDSLYHDRYAMPAIAWVCILFPLMVSAATVPANYRQVVLRGSVAVVACWLVLAAATIRTTIPLWFSDERMWTWALQTNPDSVFVMASLTDTYLYNGNIAGAEKIAKIMWPKSKSCAICLLETANLAIQEGDMKRAEASLKAADAAFTAHPQSASHNSVLSYVLMNGVVLLSNHDLAGAEGAFRDAITIDPIRPAPYMSLALVLATEGKPEEARKMFNKSVTLSAPDVIAANSQKFAQAMLIGARLTTHH